MINIKMYVYLYYLYVLIYLYILLFKTQSVTERDGHFLQYIKNYNVIIGMIKNNKI